MQTQKLPALLRALLYCSLFFILYSCKSSTCSKTVSCPGYNDTALDAWFPYNSNQQLVFKNSSNVYDTFNLQLRDSTQKYDYTTGTNTPSYGCNADKSLYTTNVDSNHYYLFSIILTGALPNYSTTLLSSVSLSFSGSGFTCSSLTDSGFSSFDVFQPNGINSNNVASQVLYNYSSGGNLYPLAQSIIADTSGSKYISGVYKIIYAKNSGIIEYETNPGNIVWIKQ